MTGLQFDPEAHVYTYEGSTVPSDFIPEEDDRHEYDEIIPEEQW